jgi:UDP-N-acetylmuramoyl-L-alanyl-D-glutamate--2,6-diaminopimelate ligase
VGSRTSSAFRPEHPSPRSLARLVQDFGIEHHGSVDDVDITGVSVSTRDLHPGDLFVGVPGAAKHGAAFAEQAREAGAVAIVTDSAGVELAAGAGLPILVLDDPRRALGDLAAWVYRTQEEAPLLFGPTGTNGKTSTAHLLDAVLRQLGMVTGLSSTAERRIGELSNASTLTTPEASELHALLARMRENGVRAVVIEVSAHALSHSRIGGIVFDVVAFTNLSRDHLDFYRDMEEYFRAKLPLFDPDRARRGVVNLDTEWGQRVVDESRIPVSTIATVGHGAEAVDADWTVEILDENLAYTEFRLRARDGRELVTREPLIGWHMASNAGLAIVMLVEAGFELEAIGQALAADGGILADLPGRLERVSGDRGPTVFVDYGHSPEAFRTSLEALRRVTPGKVIMVFGADGDRDAGKRPEMGSIASEGSDILIVTDYNPRTEQPGPIRATLLAGAAEAEHPAELLEVGDPGSAIRAAIARAGDGDSILWAGPGHENEIEVGGERIEYSARDDARAALREAGWA